MYPGVIVVVVGVVVTPVVVDVAGVVTAVCTLHLQEVQVVIVERIHLSAW